MWRPGIFMIGVYKNIEITGKTRSAVKRQGKSTDDHVANVRVVE